MKAETVMRLISGALQDMEADAERRWSWEYEPDRVCLLDFLNDAIRAIALQRPDVVAVTEVLRLEPGMRQGLPCPAVHGCRHKATLLIELTRNMDAGGTRPGRTILPVKTEILMAWACYQAEGTSIENFAYDRLTNPRFYLVYPAVSACGEVFVEASFAVEPCPVCSHEDNICLPDAYAPAIMHHALAGIFAGDSEASQLQKAAWHMQMYASLMGIKLAVDHGWAKAKSSPVPGGANGQNAGV